MEHRSPEELPDEYVLYPYPESAGDSFLQVTDHNFNCNFSSSEFPDKVFLVPKEINTDKKFWSLPDHL